MKKSFNLAKLLRRFFGLLRIVLLVSVTVSVLFLAMMSWLQKRYTPEPRIMITFTEVLLRTRTPVPAAAGSAEAAKPRDVELLNPKGTLLLNFCSSDPRIAAVLRRAVWPVLAVIVAFYWILFGALRDLCRQIEDGEIFSDENLRLVRRIGVTLVVYSAVAALAGWWTSIVLGQYLDGPAGAIADASVRVADGALEFARGATSFHLEALVTGALVLVLAEAFRQGLRLKAENDLTV